MPLQIISWFTEAWFYGVFKYKLVLGSVVLDKIVAVVVTFNPNDSDLGNLIRALESQVASVIIVDNGSHPDIGGFIPNLGAESNQIIRLEHNTGVAHAINTGVLAARETLATHVVLFDQDSIPDSNMVSLLYDAMSLKCSEGVSVAAVGPRYADIKGVLKSPFVKLIGRKLSRVDCERNEVVDVHHLISSGCLIPMTVLDDVGGMEGNLFIDYVDTEWCLRAISKGYTLYGVGAATMTHDLGDGLVQVLGKTIVVHSPLRYYYLIRNGVWLLRQPWVSWSWRVMDVVRLSKIFLVCSLLVGRRFENFKMISIGLWHAMSGKMGEYEK